MPREPPWVFTPNNRWPSFVRDRMSQHDTLAERWLANLLNTTVEHARIFAEFTSLRRDWETHCVFGRTPAGSAFVKKMKHSREPES